MILLWLIRLLRVMILVILGTLVIAMICKLIGASPEVASKANLVNGLFISFTQARRWNQQDQEAKKNESND